jgi:hypothetical protein
MIKETKNIKIAIIMIRVRKFADCYFELIRSNEDSAGKPGFDNGNADDSKLVFSRNIYRGNRTTQGALLRGTRHALF